MSDSRRAFARTSRRRFVAGAAAGSLAAPGLFAARPAAATPQDVTAAIQAIAKGKPVREGGVTVDAPALAETGNAVPVTVKVESPMTAAERCVSIHILAEQNPEAEAAEFILGPRCGKAEVSTRLRIFSPQKVYGVATFDDGSVRIGSAHVEVTLAACLDTEIR